MPDDARPPPLDTARVRRQKSRDIVSCKHCDIAPQSGGRRRASSSSLPKYPGLFFIFSYKLLALSSVFSGACGATARLSIRTRDCKLRFCQKAKSARWGPRGWIGCPGPERLATGQTARHAGSRRPPGLVPIRAHARPFEY